MSIEDFYNEFWDTTKKEANKKKAGIIPAKTFFSDWVRTPLFPKQQKIVDATFSNNYKDLSTVYNEFVIAFGKGSGKDVTIAELLNYIAYWLCTKENPQKYLGLKDDEPIDIVNVAFDKDQAQSVFFTKFKNAIEHTINPVTGNNFYEELGMDLKKDILTNRVVFPKNIRAFSLNSREYKAEGKNVIFAVFDEIGSFRFDKAEAIRKHIRSTAKSRSPKFYKLFYISFLTSADDYMAYLLERAEKGEMSRTYCDRAATWEVRNTKGCDKQIQEFLSPYTFSKSSLQDEYDEDPETAMLMYECKTPKVRKNAFIRQPEKITECVGMVGEAENKQMRKDPRLDTETLWVYDTDLASLDFEPWFRPHYTYEMWALEKQYEQNPLDEDAVKKLELIRERHLNAEYYIHIDLSRGVVDAAGLVMGHSYYVLDKRRIYVDLMLQIRANKEEDKAAEIDMSNILDFILKRLVVPTAKGGLDFPVVKITADGWNSALFLDLCRKANIEADYINIDKDTTPYNTLQDYIYRTAINYYYYRVAMREILELLTKNGKVDHPNTSQRRMKEEGLSKGSKEIADGLAGITFSITENDSEEDIAFGSLNGRKIKQNP